MEIVRIEENKIKGDNFLNEIVIVCYLVINNFYRSNLI